VLFLLDEFYALGRLQQLVRIFEEQAAKIVALSIEESGDAALVRIICDNPDLGKEVLTENGFPFGETDILAVEQDFGAAAGVQRAPPVPTPREGGVGRPPAAKQTGQDFPSRPLRQ